MIKVNYIGRFGNNLFQYSLAKIIAKNNKFAISTPNQYQDILPSQDGLRFHDPIQAFDGHQINIEEAISKIPRQIVLSGFFQRYEYYKKYKSDITKWLKIPRHTSIKPNYEDIVLHVRGGDLWGKDGPTNCHHLPCPYSYYHNILKTEVYQNILIITEDINDPIAIKIKQNWADAQIISQSVLEDFEFMRQAQKIVLSVSTLSWWAAWLSEAAVIHFPMHGLWHPDISQHINIIVDESRYIYHDVSTTNDWTASPKQIQDLLQ